MAATCPTAVCTPSVTFILLLHVHGYVKPAQENQLFIFLWETPCKLWKFKKKGREGSAFS